MADPESPGANGNERRLLVVTYHFPPDGAVGGLRWAGLTKYLARDRWRSWVLTAATGAGSGSTSGVVVEYCPQRRTLNDVYRAWRGSAAEGQSATAGGSSGRRRRSQSRGPLSSLRLEGAMLLALPDQGRGWILRAAQRARALIRAASPKVVVSSGPPHSAHLATWLALRGSPVPWIIDLRDPWAGPITEAWRSYPSYRSRLSRLMLCTSERLGMRRATAVFVNSPWLAAALRDRYPTVPMHWVPNGVDLDLLPRASTNPFPDLGIAYLGTLYGDRDLTPVLRALRLFSDRHAATGRGIRLRVAGAIGPAEVQALWATAQNLGVAAHLEVLGWLPRTEALQTLARSRLCVVLAQGQIVEVPAKLYEPVGMGIPTVVIAGARSAVAEEAARVGARLIQPDDVEGMVAVLEDIACGRLRPSGEPPPAADYSAIASQVSGLLERYGS